jgi:hypothetical protein
MAPGFLCLGSCNCDFEVLLLLHARIWFFLLTRLTSYFFYILWNTSAVLLHRVVNSFLISGHLLCYTLTGNFIQGNSSGTCISSYCLTRLSHCSPFSFVSHFSLLLRKPYPTSTKRKCNIRWTTNPPWRPRLNMRQMANSHIHHGWK